METTTPKIENNKTKIEEIDYPDEFIDFITLNDDVRKRYYAHQKMNF
jgi:hypothetical protein